MDAIELAELCGKAIRSAKVLKASPHENELSLEFEDGTSFSFSCNSRVNSESVLYRGGVGEPDVISRVNLD